MSLKKTGREIVCAKWVAPMLGPLLYDGAILIEDGMVQAIGSRPAVISGHGGVVLRDFGAAVIFPGLVNAHTHLELSDCTCGEAPKSGFASWLVGLIQRTRITAEQMEAAVRTAIPEGVRQCLRFGVTTVGDISRQCRITRPLLRETPLRVVSFGEVQAMAQRRQYLEERLSYAADVGAAGGRLTIGITPHAPYSVEPHGYRRCLEVARRERMPLATHLAESSEEGQFLEFHTGPLRDLWEAWLTWDDGVPTFKGGPIRFARELGLLDYPTLLAHVNYCDDEELEILAAGNASVVYCPRTHQYFGHPPHRWREMLRRGINVAVGTDSCASSPDLNLVDDLRLLHRICLDEPVETLWEMATVRAAKAIGISDAGVIRDGIPADLTVFAASSSDPLREVLEKQEVPIATWAAGEQVR